MSGSVDASKKKKKKSKLPYSIELTSISPVGLWEWTDILTLDCYICRSELNTTCMYCDIEEEEKQEECLVVRGLCGHAFHQHCYKMCLADLGKKFCPQCVNREFIIDRLEKTS
eukprot:TRINITY_DN372_c4_g1_i1.p1 TRINITY_DN372_c4_g1~~TRINITY_DN372_c4_g1_i1.p1  ORF type:complete len:113 (+),score=28.13 TRINITY_DN372_c4_g1_i1:27-365(+)